MLPGFRFMLAAIVLLMSILVFGFGATALLRTAHEEFASAPAWQPLPETRFAQERSPTKPVLAMLRVDDAPKAAPPVQPAGNPAPKAEVPAPDPAPVAAAPAAEQQVAPAEPAPVASAELQPSAAGNAVAPAPQDSAATSVEPKGVLAAPAQQTDTALTADLPAPSGEVAAITEPAAPSADGAASAPAVSAEATAPATPAPEASPAPEQASALPATAEGGIATKVTTLDGAPVDIAGAPKAKPAESKADAEKKRQAQREADRRRRIAAARARLAREQAAWAAQQDANPFAPPAMATRTTRH
jgi:hypothetical protein